VCVRAWNADDARAVARAELGGFPVCSVVLFSLPGDPDARSRFYFRKGMD